MSVSARASLFACSSCTQHLYAAIKAVHLPKHSSSTFANTAQYASHATFAGLRKGHHRRALAKTIKLAAKGKDIPWSRRRYSHGPVQWERKSMAARHLNNARMDAGKPERGRYNLFKELEFTGRDPLAVANIVQRGLQADQLDDALEIAKYVSIKGRDQKPGNEYVVSWNHILDYLMEHGRPKTAISLFKEMKERGLEPTPYTYTIIFRGLARNVERSTARFDIVDQALKVYRQLEIRSKKDVSSIHTNALLNVCAKAGNMEALWKVAGHFEEQGKHAPNATTYTTIIRALTRNGAEQVEEKEEDGLVKRFARDPRIRSEAVKDAEGLWQDIMHRWRTGDLELDETLVNAMAGVYLKSVDRDDCTKVFSLLEDTMGIVNTERRENGQSTTSDEVSSTDRPTQGNKVIPSQRTLTTLILACNQLRLKKVLLDYWELLTSPEHPYKIQPDCGNYLDHMRGLRVSRSSADMAALLTKLYDDPRTTSMAQLWRRVTFSLAIASCKRDVFNRNAFHNANMIMDVMLQKIPPPCSDHPENYPTPELLLTYLELAIGTQSGSQDQASPSRVTQAGVPIRAKNLLKAIPRLFPYLESLPEFEIEGKNLLLRDFIGACDRLINNKDASLIDKTDLEELKSMKQISARMQFEAKEKILEKGGKPAPEFDEVVSGDQPKYENTGEGAFSSFWTRKSRSKYSEDDFDIFADQDETPAADVADNSNMDSKISASETTSPTRTTTTHGDTLSSSKSPSTSEFSDFEMNAPFNSLSRTPASDKGKKSFEKHSSSAFGRDPYDDFSRSLGFDKDKKKTRSNSSSRSGDDREHHFSSLRSSSSTKAWKKGARKTRS